MVELNHHFETGKDTGYNWDAVLDLDRLIPCVEGGKVLERESDEKAKAEIKVKMGAMSMTFRGTVEVTERDDDAHSALFAVRPRTPAGRATPTPTCASRSTTAAARSTPRRRSPARPRRWARASCRPCSTR